MSASQIDLFEAASTTAGSLACAIEVTAVMNEVIRRCAQRDLKREDIVQRMSDYLGEPVSLAMLNAYTAKSRDTHEISLRRAMAFDAATECDALLQLFAGKRGRVTINTEEAHYIELGRIHQQERDLAERKKLIQLQLRIKGAAK